MEAQRLNSRVPDYQLKVNPSDRVRRIRISNSLEWHTHLKHIGLPWEREQLDGGFALGDMRR
jgi:hypothetical protein